MVGWGQDRGKDSKTSTMAERMTDYLLEMRRQRQAKIEEKISKGYRARLDQHGNVVVVEVDPEEA